MDYFLELGQDLIFDENGEVAAAEDFDLVRQYFLRLLMTNPLIVQGGFIVPPDLVFAPSFGVGCRGLLGLNRTVQVLKNIYAKIQTAIALTPEIATSPAPIIAVQSLGEHGIQTYIDVWLSSGQQQKTISFTKTGF